MSISILRCPNCFSPTGHIEPNGSFNCRKCGWAERPRRETRIAKHPYTGITRSILFMCPECVFSEGSQNADGTHTCISCGYTWNPYG